MLILEREVYEDEAFRETLCDAAASLRVGSAWELDTTIGPLIRPPTGPLERGLKELEASESWALRPRSLADNPRLWSPGIKWGVEPDGFTHQTELFGPVLGVMCARDLDEAIDLAHRTGYGLTAGLQSLDDREQRRFAERMRAGNLYINRGTTGAIVLRQPFGGVARSAIGPGLKAGGPNYVAALMTVRERSDVDSRRATADLSRLGSAQRHDVVALQDPQVVRLLDDLAALGDLGGEVLDRLQRAALSYAEAAASEFSREHDSFRLLGQDNLRRYIPFSPIRIRVEADDQPFDLFARVLAARAVGCRITVSAPPAVDAPELALLEALTEDWAAAIEFVEESEEDLARILLAGRIERIRYAAPDRAGSVVVRAAAQRGLHLATAPVSTVGRLELLHYVREQSVCFDYHRYGNLGARGGEERSPVR